MVLQVHERVHKQLIYRCTTIIMEVPDNGNSTESQACYTSKCGLNLTTNASLRTEPHHKWWGSVLILLLSYIPLEESLVSFRTWG